MSLVAGFSPPRAAGRVAITGTKHDHPRVVSGSDPSPRPAHQARIATVVVLAALVVVPASLLPPDALVGLVQGAAGSGRGAAYLVAAIGLHVAFYGSLGLVAAFAVGPGATRHQRWLRFLLVPPLLVALAVIVRSVKLGHVPMLANA